MKIGFDAKRAYNNATGLGNYSRLVLQSIFRCHPDAEYRLYTPKVHHRYASFLDGYPHADPILPDSRISRFLHPLWRSKGIVDQLKDDGIQLYHGLSNELPIGLKEANIRSVLTLHDLIFLRYPQYYPYVDRLFYQRKFERSCQEADVVVAISRQTAKDIEQFYGIGEEKVKIVYQDCDPGFGLEVIEEDIAAVKGHYQLPDTYLLSVGTIEQRKNQLNLIRAYRRLPADRPKLVLVGRKTAYFEQIDEYIQSNKLSEEVIILENVFAAELPALYAGAKFMVYPSHFEGFGLPLLEAMKIGLPVVSSNTSCFEEVAGEAGLYANPEDPDELADRMKSLLYDNALFEQLKQNCKIQSLRFDAKQMADQLHEIYTGLVR